MFYLSIYFAYFYCICFRISLLNWCPVLVSALNIAHFLTHNKIKPSCITYLEILTLLNFWLKGYIWREYVEIQSKQISVTRYDHEKNDVLFLFRPSFMAHLPPHSGFWWYAPAYNLRRLRTAGVSLRTGAEFDPRGSLCRVSCSRLFILRMSLYPCVWCLINRFWFSPGTRTRTHTQRDTVASAQWQVSNLFAPKFSPAENLQPNS